MELEAGEIMGVTKRTERRGSQGTNTPSPPAGCAPPRGRQAQEEASVFRRIGIQSTQALPGAEEQAGLSGPLSVTPASLPQSPCQLWLSPHVARLT